jgi:hypothetical protein
MAQKPRPRSNRRTLSLPALEICIAMADSFPSYRAAHAGQGNVAFSGAFSMRWIIGVAAVLMSLAALAGAALAGVLGPGPGLTGNDTGGIIQWTPETDQIYREIAAAHCARWNRFAGITSVHRAYGDYIAFQCIYDRRFDARKTGFPFFH